MDFPTVAQVKLLAFYLPQFHEILENNQWWGEGFTEWSNVRSAQPLFDGHYQPHVPHADIGYYNLLDSSVLSQQTAMAKKYGIEGFCFYHYWFDGKRLLEKPVDILLAHPEIDLPFCLCWANENWTRRWDGGSEEVLIAQCHSQESDVRFAADLLPYLHDVRYIKVNEKPLILIYRPDLIPDVESAAAGWREVWRNGGVGEVFLANVQSFTMDDPREIGFDAAVEFPPQTVSLSSIRPEYPEFSRIDPWINLASYPAISRAWAERETAAYTRFRTVMPAWDNASRRRKGGASVFVDSTPDCYREWLEATIAQTLVEKAGDERIIFVNAWNEWAEGCHLEPDQKYGYAYLEATRDALYSSSPKVLPANIVFNDWLKAFSLDDRQRLNIHAVLSDKNLPNIVFVIDGLDVSLELISDTLKSIVPLLSILAAKIIILTPHSTTQSSSQIIWLQTNCVPKGFWQEIALIHAGQWFFPLKAGDRLIQDDWLQVLAAWPFGENVRLIYGDELSIQEDGVANGAILRSSAERLDWFAMPIQGRHALIAAELLATVDSAECTGFDELCLLRLVLAASRTSTGIHLSQFLVSKTVGCLQVDFPAAMAICQKELDDCSIKLKINPGLWVGSTHLDCSDLNLPCVQVLLPVDRPISLLLPVIESLLATTDYPNWELVLLATRMDEQSEALLDQITLIAPGRLSVCRVDATPISPKTMIQAATTDFSVLWAADLRALHKNWLSALIGPLSVFDELAASGGLLLEPSGAIISAGLILGGAGVVDHLLHGSTLGVAPQRQSQTGRIVSALDFRGVAIRTKLFKGLDNIPDDISDFYAATDVALSLAGQGRRCYWSPYAPLQWAGDNHKYSVELSELGLRESVAQSFCERNFSALEQDIYFSRYLSDDVSDVRFHQFEFGEQFSKKAVNADLLRVIALPADSYGCGQYRVRKPAAALQKSGLLNVITASRLPLPSELAQSQPDSIVVQRLVDEPDIERLRQLRRCRELWSVFELDDYLPAVPSSSLHRGQISKDITKRIRAGLSVCDRLLVSTDSLADALSKFHSNIVVAHNYLCPDWWDVTPIKKERQDERLRIGWAGGVSHTGDLRLLQKAVRVLGDRVQWVFMGMLPEWMPPEWVEYHSPISIESYPARLAKLDLDLALAPLEINLFNRCKSNLRILEYGICGYPVLASDQEPYRCDLPVALVKTSEDHWLQAIEAKLGQREALRAEGLQLQAKIVESYLLDGVRLEAWRDAWIP
ncbi:glycoside hydrolase family 99-like domain-containing protein [uncultured Deefgea sp.]|uniref:glycoside hydrolase family 99-like domain-containing protein n=1 Tax=uncultured Deefgea sp. TaxID=1304914 RepID=UPI0025967DCF|nr:glycoside hydrolase family 99-like domain-containing protein [uncultured Deefgea sp.]